MEKIKMVTDEYAAQIVSEAKMEVVRIDQKHRATIKDLLFKERLITLIDNPEPYNVILFLSGRAHEMRRKPEADIVTLKFQQYLIIGQARIQMWGGGEAWVDMKYFYLQELPEDRSTIVFNDGGFGCEAVLEARGTIYKEYTEEESCSGYIKHMEDFEVKISAEAKRGI